MNYIDGDAPIIEPSVPEKTVLPSENVKFTCQSNEQVQWRFVGVSFKNTVILRNLYMKYLFNILNNNFDKNVFERFLGRS